MPDNTSRVITNTFTQKFKEKTSSKNVLYVGPENVTDQYQWMFSNFRNLTENLHFIDVENNTSDFGKYDLIVGDLPFGTMRKKVATDKLGAIKVETSWVYIWSIMKDIKKDGYGIFSVSPSIWYSHGGRFMKWIMEKHNIHLNAVIDPPQGILQPYTSLHPNIVLFSKNSSESLFIAKNDDINGVDIIIENLINKVSTDNISKGMLVEQTEFKGFENFYFKKQIENLQSGYKGFKDYKLIDVAKEIYPGKSDKAFNKKQNAIYLPNIGLSKVQYDLNELTLKSQNYFQIVLDSSIVINKYAASFYNSSLGKAIRNTLLRGTVIKKISKITLIEDGIIAIPEIHEQETIIKVSDKIETINDTIESISYELSINPQNASDLDKKLDDVRNQFSLITEGDELKALIRNGESRRLEFKSTWSYCLKDNEIKQYLEDKCLRNIVGMMNAVGGDLLIGVEDDGTILGMDKDLIKFKKKTNQLDSFLGFIKDKLKKRIGRDNMQFAPYKYVNVDGKKVLKFACRPAPAPVLLDGEDLAVRFSPAVEILTGQEMLDYVKKRFD